MRTAVIRRSCVAGVAALSLTLLAGCSDSGGSESGKGGSEAAEENKTPALSAADLEKVVLKDGDVKGHKVTEPTATVDQKDVKTKDEACTPVAYAAIGTVIDEPGATVQRETASEPTAADAKNPEDALDSGLDVTRTLLRLSSYEGDGAKTAMDSLTKAVDACAKGFAVTADGTDQQVTKVAKATAPQGADQAVAVDVVTEAEGAKVPMKVVVIRKGSTVGYFTALNIGSLATGKDFDFPTAVVDAQVAKLG